MSFFGAFYMALAAISGISNSIHEERENKKAINRAKQNDSTYYTDIHGMQRKVSDKEAVSFREVDGRRCITTLNGRIIKNLDKPYEDGRIQKAQADVKKKYDSVRCIGVFKDKYRQNETKWNWLSVRDKIVCEDNAGEYYFWCMNNNGKDFFVRISDGKATYLFKEDDNFIKMQNEIFSMNVSNEYRLNHGIYAR